MFRFLTDSPFHYLKAFTDSSQKDLLKVLGNIPVRYQGEKQHQLINYTFKMAQEAGVMLDGCTAFAFNSDIFLRSVLQLTHPAVAVGFVPLHATYLLSSPHSQHADQGGQTCGCQGPNLPACTAQLGPCRELNRGYVTEDVLCN